MSTPNDLLPSSPRAPRLHDARDRLRHALLNGAHLRVDGDAVYLVEPDSTETRIDSRSEAGTPMASRWYGAVLP